MSAYRILPHPNVSASTFAMAPRRSRVEDAVADMGEGIVTDATGRLVAFHERHLAELTRTS